MIFWIIILLSILIVFIMSGTSIIYQTLTQRAEATLTAIPTITAEALEAIYQKGLAEMNIGRWEKAKSDLDVVFEINPNYKDIQVKLKEVETEIARLNSASTPDLSRKEEANSQLTSPEPEEVNLATDVVAYYSFDGNANDQSGYHNHGTVYGAALTTDRFDQPNKAYSFDGVDDYILVPDSNSLDLTTEATFSIWANIADDIDYNVYGSPHLFSKGATYGVLWADYGFLIEPTQSYLEIANDANNYQRATFPLIPETQWVHLVIVFQNGTATLYQNGVPVTQPVTIHSPIRASTQPLYIGHRYLTVHSGRFKGKLDDFRIYSYAFSQSEVQALYNSEK